MTEGWGDLSGYTRHQVYINVYRTGQNWDGNFSSYHAVIRFLANGHSHWSNDQQSWGANLGGWSIGGNFTIPRGSGDFTLWEGDFNRVHDWAGFGSGFQSSASISANHPDIGSGSVTVGEETPPRIPKTPNVPNNLRIESVLPTSFGVRYDRGDDMGAATVQDQAHWYARGPAGQGTFVWEDNGPAGYTNPAGASGAPQLTPGTMHYVYVRSRNSRGWGPWAGPISAETLAGGRAFDGTSFRNCKVRMWNGSRWQLVRVRQWSGSAWRNTR
ncbi:fibronectin type III domain-containing protein [Microbacterium thalli]|uniref:fibronectin type III domain-containing protein n=1 Tax=Microbacterium thalli TaxID=3027921 RepID=UPI0023673E00|nr:fibronectin type III domain-containing protein [Microbacterium thalli]MDD7929697.1 fibronectin type III domain-containing protein [Microbacterium thalli]